MILEARFADPRLRRGKSFGTVHKEGGTNIRWAGGRFVMQDFGEAEERKEFTGARRS